MNSKTNKDEQPRLVLETELVKDYDKVVEEIKELAKENYNKLKPLYDALDKYPTLKKFIGHFIMQFKVEVWNKEDEETESLKQAYKNLKEGIRPTKFKQQLYCLDCQEPFIKSEGLKDTSEQLEFSLKFRNAEKLKEITSKLSSEGNIILFQIYTCENHKIIMVESLI